MPLMSAQGDDDLVSFLKIGIRNLNVAQLINLITLLNLACKDAEDALEELT